MDFRQAGNPGTWRELFPAKAASRPYFYFTFDKELTNLQTKQLLTGAAVIAGLLLVVVAVLYFNQPAGSLPAFLPGHEAGMTGRHTKHGILAFALAFCCFIAARFFWGASPDKRV